MDKSPSFSWSKSRYWYWNNCRRQYYYNYIGYWNGWLLKAPQRTRQIYFCKNLAPLNAVVGVIAHSVIKDFWMLLWNGVDELEVDDMYVRADRLWAKYIHNTVSKEYRNIKKTPAILELANDWIKQSELDSAIVKTKDCLSNFHWQYLNRFNRVATADSIRFIDDAEMGFFEITEKDNLRVYAVVDLAFGLGEQTVVVDWKTGDSEADHDLQLKTYGLWAFDELDATPETIEFWIANLSSNSVQTKVFFADDYFGTLDLIEESAQKMRSFQNKPEDSFLISPAESKCKACAFMEVCPHWNSKHGL